MPTPTSRASTAASPSNIEDEVAADAESAFFAQMESVLRSTTETCCDAEVNRQARRILRKVKTHATEAVDLFNDIQAVLVELNDHTNATSDAGKDERVNKLLAELAQSKKDHKATLAKLEESLKIQRDHEAKIAQLDTQLETAKGHQRQTELTLQPSKERLAEYSDIGVRVHKAVIGRVMRLQEITALYQATDAGDDRRLGDLARELTENNRALIEGWKMIREDYLKITRGGEYQNAYVNASTVHATAHDDEGTTAIANTETVTNDAAEARVELESYVAVQKQRLNSGVRKAPFAQSDTDTSDDDRRSQPKKKARVSTPMRKQPQRSATGKSRPQRKQPIIVESDSEDSE